MNQEILKFQKLMITDVDFQKKLREAANKCFSKDPKVRFDEVINPVAKEYGISASYDELIEFLDQKQKEDNMELSVDDLSQVAGGGKTSGVGFTLCYKFGVGVGGEDDNCCLIAGQGETGVCVASGAAT